MNAPAVQQLSADVCVAGQLDPSAMAWAAAGRLQERDQQPARLRRRPGPADERNDGGRGTRRRAAYAHLPVQPAVQTPEEIAAFARLLAELPKPVLAFCRSGARSGKLYAASQG